MKVSKLSLMIVVAILAILALATTVSAYTSADLENYITGSHTISGSQYELSSTAKADVKAWFEANQLTPTQAEQVKSLLDQAKNKINSTGASSLNQVSRAVKEEAVNLLKSAGNIAGVQVSVNTSNKTVTISDDGTAILNGSYNSEGTNGVTVRTYTNPAAVGGGNGGNGGAGASGAAASNGSTIPGFAKTGSTVSIYAVVALIAVVAVSTIFVKKVNAK